MYKQQKGGGKKTYTKSFGTPFGFVLTLIFLTTATAYFSLLLSEMINGMHDVLIVQSVPSTKQAETGKFDFTSEDGETQM